MKTIILVFLFIFGLHQNYISKPQCISGLGHVKGDVISVHFSNFHRIYIDTLITGLEENEYKVQITNDTTYYQCVRCDSTFYEISDTIFSYIRTIPSR